MYFIQIFTIAFASISFSLVQCEKVSKLYNIDCHGNPKFVENATCYLKAVRRDTVLAFMDLDVIDMLKNITVRYRVFKFYNQFRPFLVDIEFNWCDVFSLKSIGSFYANQIVRIARKYCNIMYCKLSVNPLSIEIFQDYSSYFRVTYMHRSWNLSTSI